MVAMSSYCKAYDLTTLTQFPNWKMKDGVSLVPVSGGGAEDKVGDSENRHYYLFLHDNFRVTTGVHSNEGIVYDEITPEWIEFCKSTLKFAPLELNGK